MVSYFRGHPCGGILFSWTSLWWYPIYVDILVLSYLCGHPCGVLFLWTSLWCLIFLKGSLWYPIFVDIVVVSYVCGHPCGVLFLSQVPCGVLCFEEFLVEVRLVPCELLLLSVPLGRSLIKSWSVWTSIVFAASLADIQRRMLVPELGSIQRLARGSIACNI